MNVLFRSEKKHLIYLENVSLAFVETMEEHRHKGGHKACIIFRAGDSTFMNVECFNTAHAEETLRKGVNSGTLDVSEIGVAYPIQDPSVSETIREMRK